MKVVDLLAKKDSRSASFGAKVAPCLWRADLSFMNSVTGSCYADLSFMNSVTGSGYEAKCSNILKGSIKMTKYLRVLKSVQMLTLGIQALGFQSYRIRSLGIQFPWGRG
jgi:hypothetical protein